MDTDKNQKPAIPALRGSPGLTAWLPSFLIRDIRVIRGLFLRCLIYHGLHGWTRIKPENRPFRRCVVLLGSLLGSLLS